MQKIKLALKVFNSKSKVEKILVKLANNTISDFSEEKHLEPLIQTFLSSETTEDGENFFAIFNTYLKNCRGWIGALKLLYVSHRLIDEIGQSFCDSFLSEHFENIQELMKSKSGVEDYVHAVLSANYYNFLMIYAKYFPDIQKQFVKDPAFVARQLKQGQHSDLVQLLTFTNVVKYFTKLEECIEGSANILKEKSMLTKISALLFRDVIGIYNMISKSLQQFMSTCMFQIDGSLAIILDELYSDMVQVTKKLRQIIEKTTSLKHEEIPQIHYFSFDSEFNKQEELFILQLKKTMDKNEQKKLQVYLKCVQEYQTLMPGKGLYKLNSKVSILSKGPDDDYMTLEDELSAPVKIDDASETTAHGMPSMGGNVLSCKDITANLRLDDQSPLDKVINFDEYCNTKQKGANNKATERSGSRIFSPTSQQSSIHYIGENSEDFPSPLIKKK